MEVMKEDDSNIALKYYSSGPCFGGRRVGWGSPGHQAPLWGWRWAKSSSGYGVPGLMCKEIGGPMGG